MKILRNVIVSIKKGDEPVNRTLKQFTARKHLRWIPPYRVLRVSKWGNETDEIK